jgi:hypothetical protein
MMNVMGGLDGSGADSPHHEGGPWWNYPTPLGAPQIQNPSSPCWSEVAAAPNGEEYAAPVNCGPWMPGTHFNGGWAEAWLDWVMGWPDQQ